MHWRNVVIFTLAITALKPDAALAVTLSCPNQQLTVKAPNADLADRVCSIADKAQDRLSACHLRQTEPFTIEVSHQLAAEFDGCFGIYHCDSELVQLLSPDALSEAVKYSEDFAGLPVDVLFDSLVVHEISHVLSYQSSRGLPRTMAEAEYVAYTMQLESLPEKIRSELLAAHTISKPVTLMQLNDVILSFSTEVFAIKAWTHFRTEGNGCDFVRDILEQKVKFPKQ